MNDQYFITNGDEQRGPYTISQLRSMWHSGSITASTLYWQDGLNEWVPLSTILDLLEPPAPPIQSSEPKVIYAPAPKPQPQTSGCTWIIIIALGIVGGVILISFG